MDWELPHVARTGGPTPGDRVHDFVIGLLDQVSGMVEDGVERGRDALLHAPAGDVAAAAASAWAPLDLTLSFGKDGAVDAAGHLLFQCVTGLLSGRSGSFAVSVELPPALAARLTAWERSGAAGARKSGRERLAVAIGALAVVDEM